MSLKLHPAIAIASAVLISLSLLTQLPPPKYIETGISGFINDASVAPVIAALQLATSSDTVIIHINSEGGQVSSGNLVLEAMKASKAKNIIADVGSYAASMAAEIALAAPVLRVGPQSLILIHTVGFYNYQTGEQLKILPYERNEVLAAIDPLFATNSMLFSRDLFIDTVERGHGLFSIPDFIGVIDGKDVIGMTGSILWASSPNFVGGKFIDLVEKSGFILTTNLAGSDFLTGLRYNKLLSLSYKPMLLDLTRLTNPGRF